METNYPDDVESFSDMEFWVSASAYNGLYGYNGLLQSSCSIRNNFPTDSLYLPLSTPRLSKQPFIYHNIIIFFIIIFITIIRTVFLLSESNKYAV